MEPSLEAEFNIEIDKKQLPISIMTFKGFLKGLWDYCRYLF